MKYILSLVLVIAFSPSLLANPIKIMSYNIRYDNAGDGVNQWGKRKDSLLHLIKASNPDVLCIQEALVNQMNDIQQALPNYAAVGVGRDDGKTKGEYAAIFYRTCQFKLITKGQFWLSATPDSAGNLGWDAACVRICTWANLYDITTQQHLFVFNTHMDHVGVIARKKGAKLIRAKIEELAAKTPTLLCGDFNSEPGDSAYLSIVQPIKAACNFSDTYKPSKTFNCTFTGFSTASTECKRIDYIFYSSQFTCTAFAILNKNNGLYYPSDHQAIVAVVQLKL